MTLAVFIPKNLIKTPGSSNIWKRIKKNILRYSKMRIYLKKTFKCLWTQSKMHRMLTFEKTQKYYFVSRMKYSEGSLMKSFGKIFREH